MADSADHQLAILQLAREKGLDTARIPPAQYRALSIQVRSLGQLVKDVNSAVISRAATGLKLRVIPQEKAAGNEEICRSNICKRFRELQDTSSGVKEPACDACNCSGKWLASKWKDAAQSCPRGFWDNRHLPFEEKDLPLPMAPARTLGDAVTRK